ncbi:MAG: DUF4199 domain-containing protein [Flavobacteriales bacterium]|nr:DUF4199 domain-containing protein [Flavobacteriales bacterium]
MKYSQSVVTGFLVFVVSIVLFLVVYTFFYNENYYKISLGMNFFALSTLFTFGAIYAVEKRKKKQLVDFKDAFSSSFVTMFIGGSLFVLFVYLFMNYIDKEAGRTFYIQYLEVNLQSLDKEFKPYIEENNQEKIDIYKAFREQLTSDEVRNKNIFTLKNSFYVLGLLYLGYLFLSVILSLFLRHKSVR